MQNVLDLYSLLWKLTRGMAPVVVDGQERKCKRLQTFAVLSRESQLESNTLDKDLSYVGKKLFYSRLWEDQNWRPSAIGYELPGLFLFMDDIDFEMRDEYCTSKLVKWRMMVLDNAPKKDAGEFLPEDYCSRRTVEEVENDTHGLMEQVLALLYDTVLAEVTYPDLSTEILYAPIAWLDQAVIDGAITSYNHEPTDNLEHDLFGKESQRGYQTFEGVSIVNPFNSDNLIGTFVSFHTEFFTSWTQEGDFFRTEVPALGDR